MDIIKTSRYKKGIKKYNGNRAVIDELEKVIDLFVTNQPLPTKYRDHELKGKYKGIRELHLKPDDLLMYVKVEHECVTLLAIGSHSNLFK